MPKKPAPPAPYPDCASWTWVRNSLHYASWKERKGGSRWRCGGSTRRRPAGFSR
jgi:hypothetical protein